MLINLSNTLTQQEGIQQTYVATASAAGGTSLGVKNIDGFNNQFAAQIGQTGEETAEIMIISGVPAGTQLNFGTSPSHAGGTTLFAHAQDSPIYQVHYDQVVLYRSTNGTAGAFGSLATVNIQPDSPYTSYDDTTGIAGYAYYAQFYNSINGDLSGSSSVFTPGGPTFYSLQAIRQRVKDKLYSAGYIRDDSIITSWINEAYELLTNAAIKVNQGYLLGTSQVGFGTSGYGTISDPAYKQMIKMEVTYDGVTYIPSTEIALRDYSDADFFDASSPRHAWTGEVSFRILPFTNSGSVRMTYAQRFTPMVNDSDELTQTLKGYTTAFTEYCLSVAYGLDQKDAESQQHYQQYQQGKQDFISEIIPRDQTGVKLISLGESISGLEDDLANEISEMLY